MKKLLSILLTLTLVLSLTTTAFAAPDDPILVEVTVEATIIDVTQDTFVTITFDPADGSVVSTGYSIRNNNQCPLDVNISGIELADGTDYELVAPTAKTWTEVTSEEKVIALAIKPDASKSNSAVSNLLSGDLWSTDIDGEELIGTLEPGGTGYFDFDLKHSFSIVDDTTLSADMAVVVKLI